MSTPKRTKARNNEVYARALCWAVLKRDGKPIWGKMSAIILHYVIGMLERTSAFIRKNHIVICEAF